MSLFDDDDDIYDTEAPVQPRNEEGSDSDEEEPVAKKGRGQNRQYRFVNAFDTIEEFRKWWDGDEDKEGESRKWRAMQKHENKLTETEFYRCKFAKRAKYKCPKVVRVDYSADDESVIVFESINEHNDEPEEPEALSDNTKATILELMNNGLPPLRIHNTLIKKKVAPLPTLLQVQNVCKRARKEDGSRAFTVEQLREYCVDEKAVPDCDNEPYVVHHVVESADKFCVIWTTRKLVQKHAGQKLVQVDSTCKTNWYGFPVQMAGFSDANKVFHPTLLCVSFTEDTWTYSQMLNTLRSEGLDASVVLGDGAKEITAAAKEVFEKSLRAMCWAHVVRQVDKRLCNFPKELKERFREEFHLLQFARTSEEFTKGWPDFCSTAGRTKRDELARYLCSVWIKSPEHFWFEAAHPFVTSNNGLESHNRLIKQAHTLRRLLPFAQFLKEAKAIVHAWSVRSENPAAVPEIKPFVYNDAYKLSKSGRVWRKISNKDLYVFASEASKIRTKEDLAVAFEKFEKGELESFGDFKDIRFKVHIVQKSVDGRYYQCTCWTGSKKSMCKHAVMVQCLPSVNLSAYPPDATSELLTQKKKTGRPSQKKSGRPSLAETQNRHAVAN